LKEEKKKQNSKLTQTGEKETAESNYDKIGTKLLIGKELKYFLHILGRD
jgi:hypothetical protein